MKKVIIVGLPLAFLVGCTSSNSNFPPEISAYRTPVDSHTGIQNQNHRNVTRGYNKRNVIEPDKWRNQNVVPSPVQEPSA
ncbi:MAG: hypothetical protein P1U83_18915 [Roseovarius sp.]|nr:hypothetical protein [Roseovarius sp.]|tara:strand:+ start:2983 stop:3222 length:240 start_codon:yes stop_codon:yes gene_type:complete